MRGIGDFVCLHVFSLWLCFTGMEQVTCAEHRNLHQAEPGRSERPPLKGGGRSVPPLTVRWGSRVSAVASEHMFRLCCRHFLHILGVSEHIGTRLFVPMEFPISLTYAIVTLFRQLSIENGYLITII